MGHGLNEGSPRTVSNGKLVDTPHAEVARIFSGLPAYLDSRRGINGGKIRAVKPRVRPEHFIEGAGLNQITGYHVEMSYTEEQNDYVQVTTAMLNKLVRGEHVRYADSVPSFSERVQAYFTSYAPSEARFRQALASATVELYEDFAKLYPGLMPVVGAIIHGEGKAGTTFTLGRCAVFLGDAMSGELTEANVNEDPYGYTNSEEFLGIHPGDYHRFGPHEIWCPGEKPAKALIQQSKYAAVALVKEGKVPSEYDPRKESEVSFASVVTDIKAIVQKTAELQVEQ